MATTTTTSPPTFLGLTLSSMQSLLGRPQLLTGIFRDVLMRHFYSVGNIEEPDLRELVWKEGETTSILIESVHRWRPELTEHRPAVLIKRNTLQNMRRGIGDRQQGNPVDAFGDEHYATFWVGSHTMFCLGGSGAQAELLGTEVQRELTEFGPAIRQALDILRVQVMQMGAVTGLEEARENWVVPVTVGYGYSEQWRLTQIAPKLNAVSLSLLVE
jgi:hypothetical protein